MIEHLCFYTSFRHQKMIHVAWEGGVSGGNKILASPVLGIIDCHRFNSLHQWPRAPFLSWGTQRLARGQYWGWQPHSVSEGEKNSPTPNAELPTILARSHVRALFKRTVKQSLILSVTTHLPAAPTPTFLEVIEVNYVTVCGGRCGWVLGHLYDYGLFQLDR